MNIVYVYVGNDIPRYGQINIVKTIEKIRDHNFFLLTDSNFNIKIQQSKLKLVEIQLEPKKENLSNQLSHDNRFRNGFWTHTLSRFFYLEEFSKIVQEPFIHVELDVILSKKFPFESFSLIEENLAYPLVSSTRGIASVFYVRNTEAISHFTKFILKKILQDSTLTDMSLLGSYKNEYPHKVKILPTSIHQSDRDFTGIFDGAAIGMYLTGTDPRNFFGISKIYQTFLDHEINPARNTIEEKNGSIFVGDGKFISKEIYNLHVHSKQKKYFNDSKHIKKNIVSSQKKYKLKQKIYILVTVKIILSAIKRRFINLIDHIF